MSKERKTYLKCFHSPSCLQAISIEVQSRNPEEVELPEGVCAFQFHDVITVPAMVKGVETFVETKPFNLSAKYYVASRMVEWQTLIDSIPYEDATELRAYLSFMGEAIDSTSYALREQEEDEQKIIFMDDMKRLSAA